MNRFVGFHLKCILILITFLVKLNLSLDLVIKSTETQIPEKFMKDILPDLNANSLQNFFTQKQRPRIIGGEDTPIYYPYHVSLQIPMSQGWKHICGGAIITKKHILTAAHCIANKNPTKLSILAGVKNLDETGSRHSVQQITTHDQYKAKIAQNDIGIIRIGPVKLSNQYVPEQTKCLLTGYGRFSSMPIQYSRNLKRIQLTTIANEVCKQTFATVSDANLCTLEGVNQSACQGDSGGPLVMLNTGILIGVVSFGSSICGLGFPDVFTRISSYHQWIIHSMI